MVRRAWALGAAVALVCGLAGTAAAQTVDEVVALNYKSKGGDTWKTIQTQKLTGVAMAQGFEVGMVMYGKRPGLGRQDLTIAIPGQPAITITQIYDGQKSWMINPMTGSDAPQELSGMEGDMLRDQSDFDGPLVDYKAKGHTVELVGPSTVGSRKTHHLKVTRKDNRVDHYHIDAETGAELKVVSETALGNVETEMGDYKVIDGVHVPHLIKASQGGQVAAEVRISKVEFNVPIEDSVFRVK